MYYLATLMMIQTSSYGLRNHKPFSVYGDSVCLFFQNLMIISLIWYYNESITKMEKVLVFVFKLGYILVLFLGQFYTEEIWQIILTLSTVLNMVSRLPQIYLNWRTCSTGEMAFATFLLNWVGAVARGFTVMVEASNDWAMKA